MVRRRRARHAEAHGDSPIGRVFVEAHANRLHPFIQPAVFGTFETLRVADGAGDWLGDELRVAFRAVHAGWVEMRLIAHGRSVARVISGVPPLLVR